MPVLVETTTETDVQRYMDAVISGSAGAGRLEKLAVQRYIDDRQNAADRAIYFDPDAAQIALDFFPNVLQHSKGRWSGQPFELSGWQKFIIWNLFGFKNMDGSRRFRVSYTEVGRKNGKSTFAAGLGLFMLIADGENGAEIYAAATKKDQARIIYDEADRMVKQSVGLRSYVQLYRHSILMPTTESKFEPLSSDTRTMDGLNPHCAIVDELHAHKTSELWDMFDSAVGSRTQPLLFAVTTAGFNQHGVCKDQHDYGIKVLESIIEDDTMFVFICSLDEKDDWQDESVWRKANPNLEICVDLDDMRRMKNKAIESPAHLNNFLCKKLNIWTNQQEKFFSMEHWKKCSKSIDINTLSGQPCWMAVDLSTKIDLTALAHAFKLKNDDVFLDVMFFCPKETAQARSRDDRVPYLKWAEQGWLQLTEGNVVDYAFIKYEIEKSWGKYDVKKMGFDQWNFEALRQQLITDGMDESRIVEFKQTLSHMSEPLKELEKIVIGGNLVFNNNPVLTWCAENTAIYRDPNDNIRPVKNKSTERIDGIVASVMAIGLMTTQAEQKTSVYETRGILEL